MALVPSVGTADLHSPSLCYFWHITEASSQGHMERVCFGIAPQLALSLFCDNIIYQAVCKGLEHELM